MSSFSDRYTRKQGLRRTYDYKVRITSVRRTHCWEGVVRFDGQLKGSPAGQVGFRVPADVVEATARVMIETAIEELAGVVE